MKIPNHFFKILEIFYGSWGIFDPVFLRKKVNIKFGRIEKLKIHEQKNGLYFFGKKPIKILFSAKDLYYI